MTEIRPKSLRLVSQAAACAAALISPSAALAFDDADAPTATVVVTGERARANPYADPEAAFKVDKSASGKFTEDLQDTPKTVVVLPKEALDALGAQAFRDIARTQPGITLGTGEGGNAFGDRIFIRGFDARNDVYIDGVRDPGVGVRELFAVEQVEILKGPSSTFGGRGTTGGAVSLVSKAPAKENFGDAEATLGSDATRRVSLDVNRAPHDDVQVRVNALYHEAGVAGRDFVESERWGVAAAAVWRPTDRLTLDLDYYHLTTDALPDWGVPYDTANNRPFEVRRSNYYGVLSRDFQKTFADVYTAKAAYAFSDAALLKTTVRYGQSANKYTASAPEQPNAAAGTVRANAKRRDAVTEYLVNQTDLRLDFATGPIDHTLVVGFELSREETLNRTRAFTECAVLPCTGTAANPTLSLYSPDPTIPFGSATEVTGKTVIDTETAAVYVLDTIKPSRFVDILIGGRFDDYSAVVTGVSPIRESQSELVNWQTGLAVKPTAAASYYVSYGSSSNPPCEQMDALALDYGGCDPRVAGLDPVDNTALELGGKWTLFGGHFLATAAVFRTERDGVPVSINSSTVGPSDQRVDGVEFTVAGNVTDWWSLFGGYTLLDTEITDSPVAVQAGSKFPNVSEESFSLTNRFELSPIFFFGGTTTYNSEKFGGTINALSTQTPSYWRYDLFGGIDLTDTVEVTFNVLNLTDETYYDALYRSATPFTYIAPGRSVLVSLDVDF